MAEGIILRRGGGAGGLNFKVVGGTTQPGNPKENMLWVNTGAEITGWTFQPKEPANALEGMVWIVTNQTGLIEFNALKKNGIHIYPFGAQQYIGGAWTIVEIWMYKEGSWLAVTTETFVYRDGVENTALIGGWSTTGSVTNDGENLVFKGSNVKASTVNKIDLSMYTRLVFTAKNTAGAAAQVGYGSTPTSFAGQATIKAYINDFTDIELDLSGTSGEYYLIVQSASASNVVSVEKIMLYA